MANKFWRGTANDADWSNTNNWSATQFGATGAGAPASNDVVSILDGSQSITAYDASAVDLNSLTIGPNYTGTIGSASAPLKIAVSGTTNSTLLYNGRCPYCKIQAGTNGIDILHVEGTGGGKFYLVAGTTAEVLVGTAADLTVEAAAVISASILAAGGVISIADNATDIPLAEFNGPCIVNSYRDIDAVVVGPQASYTTFEDVTIDTSIDNWGTFTHNSTGTIAKIIGRAGSLSQSLTSRYAGFTVTGSSTPSANSVKYQGSRFFEDDTGITFTNEPRLVGHTAR